MVRTRRSGRDAPDYRDSIIDQDVSVDGWTPRTLRSRYRVTRRQHWPTQLVSRRLRAIKMPRIMYPESEDTEAEKFDRRRRRPVSVYFKTQNRIRRKTKTRHSETVGRQLRPLQPNNYMEESDKPLGETENRVRRSGRQRKLLHHSFNESWITNELKVKGYPRLFNLNHTTTSSETSSDDEVLCPKRITKPLNGTVESDNEKQNFKDKKQPNQSTKAKKENKSEDEKDQNIVCENGSVSNDSDKSEIKKTEEKEEKPNSEDGEEKTSGNKSRRGRPSKFGRSSKRNIKKDDIGTNSQESASESENSSDSGSDETIRRPLRRSNRNKKPRNNFIESASHEENQYSMRKKPYNARKKYSLRERKQQKIRTRPQSPSSSSSSSSSDTEEDLNVSVKNKTKTRQKSKTLGEHHSERALREIQPIQLDGSIRFSSVGGLEEHIRCLREMVLFPLMYPQLFERFGFHPPKGVLFHGPPGTGKTLLARALANECTIQGGQKVSFFMRKGADCLKKWVGESERNIKLIFQQASKMKPSIIFFDEIDALAPVRSARQDQVHTSVVGTLLAEMDGLCDRGEVIVIGATNRLDSVDPALRRAGRFDRELHFPHPSADQRAAILRVLTLSWNPPPSNDTIDYMSNITTGYGGSDLKALCSESILKALERTYPQVYKNHHALLIDHQKIEVQCEDMVHAMKTLVAAGSRCAPPPTRSLPHYLKPLLHSNTISAVETTKRIFPLANKNHKIFDNIDNKNAFNQHWSSSLLIRGSCSTTFIGPAVLASVEHCAIRELSMSTLNQGIIMTTEQAILTVFAEIRRCAQHKNGCIIYIPAINLLWPLLGDSGCSLILHLWQDLSALSNCLLLATCDCCYDDLPEMVQELFPIYKDCVYDVKETTPSEISNFLRPLFLVKPMIPPPSKQEVDLPELPRAPPPPPPRPSAIELKRSARREAHLLRELRIFLRDVCRKLAANRRFYKFTKPVDLEEVTDYLSIVKQPMDLETMMTKVDRHCYNCARDFLKDVDLIVANALEYNPDRTSSDKQIRHEACSLRDHAYALVEVEMDTDFEEECREIAALREKRDNNATNQDLPDFIYTANNTFNGAIQPVPNIASEQPNTTDIHTPDIHTPDIHTPDNGCDTQNSGHTTSNKRKRKKKHSMWSKGMVAKKSKISKDANNPMITDEESKENKPVCTTPVFGEPSATDNDTGPSEHDHDRGVIKPSESSNGNSNSQTAKQNEDEIECKSTAKKIRLENEEMLFDANAMDCVPELDKSAERSLSPKISNETCSSSVFTSTPRRRKSSLEHSSNDCDKLIVNIQELESVFHKCLKLVKTFELKQIIELYYQLDRVLNNYTSKYDRSSLPEDLENAVENFIQMLSK